MPSPKERRRLREARGLSEDQVAEAMGVTPATVRSWETGRTSPRGRKQEAYAKLLGAYDEQSTPSAPSSGSQPEPARAPEPVPLSKSAATPLTGAGPATANTRPRAATKRAAKPPKAPAASALGLGTGGLGGLGGTGGGQKAPRTVRAGGAAAHQPLEKLKPVEAPPQPQQPPAGLSSAPSFEDVEAAPEAHEVHMAHMTRVTDEANVAHEGHEVHQEPSLTPEQAFDALYAHAAPGLVHQTYLLTGRRRLSRESVEYAFHHAWEHWPEVAVDRDPVGWVRAAAYEYALSPWHRLRRGHKHPDAPPTEPGRRELLAALLELPPPYRRTVLLYDGLGLDLPDTAAETEASTPAAANRLLHARTVIGQRVPELADPDALHQRLGALATEAPATTIAEPRAVRAGSERRSRLWTRAVIGVTAALIAVTAVTAATAPTQYLPVNHPGETVNGVPVRGGSPKLTPEDVKLHDKLRSQPHHGPERLIPDPH
ncbi:helix-turn-helix domain-containing protein [Streptomyces sp. Je 1-79]|uniref:helix-turn-helix domain-containing protein n=1 Tax=Streptomyces sp. Je 1-79 TaxID=2943847 RepID=UPI0021A54A45|nr:helix-turn-helix domain-containing protein [Streptomyces sp. Je 1-79]MCT4355705.1 helix-turn-helix domain-containing protein [Streptomyces sp. Je 1-79]